MGRLDPERIDAALIAALRARASSAALAARGARCQDSVRAWTLGLEAVASKVEAGLACDARDSAMLKAFLFYTSPENILGFKEERSWQGVVPKGCEITSTSANVFKPPPDSDGAPLSDSTAVIASVPSLRSALGYPSASIPYLLARGEGGWGAATDPFQVRGRSYLSDNVKVRETALVRLPSMLDVIVCEHIEYLVLCLRAYICACSGSMLLISVCMHSTHRCIPMCLLACMCRSSLPRLCSIYEQCSCSGQR
jgi:hypothetical protein